MDSRTVYIGHKEPPPGAEAYIPQRYPDNRIVSSKVSDPQLLCESVQEHCLSSHSSFVSCLDSHVISFVRTFLRMTHFTFLVFVRRCVTSFLPEGLEDDVPLFILLCLLLCVCIIVKVISVSHSTPSGTLCPRICLSSLEESQTSISWSYFLFR